MLILGIDTSGPNGSIALVRFEGGESRTLETAAIEGGTFSAQLVPQILRLLQNNSLSKYHIDAFAVVSGPGSFTGLRVGLAAVKALAETLQKPIAAISLLEAIAFNLSSEVGAGSPSERVLIALDARRNEVFVGEYEIGSETPVRISESLCSREELVALSKAVRVFSPDTGVFDFLETQAANSRVAPVSRLDAAGIAKLGFRKIAAGHTVSALDLDANYIRRSDAEIKASTMLR